MSSRRALQLALWVESRASLGALRAQSGCSRYPNDASPSAAAATPSRLASTASTSGRSGLTASTSLWRRSLVWGAALLSTTLCMGAASEPDPDSTTDAKSAPPPAPPGLRHSSLSPEVKKTLESTPFLRHLANKPTVAVVDSSDLSSALPINLHDHLFEALKKNRQLRSYTCLYDYDPHAKGPKYFAVFDLGADVCGFPGITHGGLSAAMCDEAFGGLIQGLKLEGVLRPGPAYTVHLSMQYKKMLPSRTTVVVSASLDKVESEGRKVWMNAVLSDANGPEAGTTFATSRALFVHPSGPTHVMQAVKHYIHSRMA